MHGFSGTYIFMGCLQLGMSPYSERDDGTGRFKPEFEDSDFIEVLEGESGAAGLSTSEVAELVGCEYRTAYARLGDLRDDGVLSSREVGGSLLWFVD